MSSQFPEFLSFSEFFVSCPKYVRRRGGLSPARPRTGLFKLVPWSRACNGIYGDSLEWRRISANGDDDGNCFISSATRALILSRLMKRNYYQGTFKSVRLWSSSLVVQNQFETLAKNQFIYLWEAIFFELIYHAGLTKSGHDFRNWSYSTSNNQNILELDIKPFGLGSRIEDLVSFHLLFSNAAIWYMTINWKTNKMLVMTFPTSSIYLREHSTTTWTRFDQNLTPSPPRVDKRELPI